MSLKSKILSLSIISLISVTALVGCSSSSDNPSSNSSQKQNEENKSPVLVKDIEFVDAKVLEPDSIGTIYFETQFKNNSDKAIKGISIELELDNKEVAYLSSYDTIKPGETTSKTQCFGPTTGNKDDMKAKSVSITAIDGDKEMYIDYDIKLDKYDVIEGDVASNTIKSPVVVSDIEFVNPQILDPDSIGSRYFKTQLKNNSKSIITSASFEYELDNGEVAYLSSYDTLLPGDTSSNTECFAPTTGNKDDMKLKTVSITVLDENKKEIYIDYDVKLDKYDVVESID